MSFFELYLITTLIPNLSCVSGLILIALCITFGVVVIAGYSSDPDMDDLKRINNLLKRIIKWALIPLTICVAMPDTKAMMIIYSGRYLTNNENIKKLPDSAAQVLNKLAQDYLEENKPVVTQSKKEK